MTHDPSRKHFLAKLIGLVAVAGLAPKLFAKTPAALALSRLNGPATPTPVPLPVVSLRPEPRAVARRGDVA